MNRVFDTEYLLSMSERQKRRLERERKRKLREVRVVTGAVALAGLALLLHELTSDLPVPALVFVGMVACVPFLLTLAVRL